MLVRCSPLRVAVDIPLGNEEALMLLVFSIDEILLIIDAETEPDRAVDPAAVMDKASS